MPHLKTFSRLHHGRFSEYDKGLTGSQPYLIDDDGTQRQIEIDDLYNPDLNFHFSDQTVSRIINDQEVIGGRRISFKPKTINNSPEFSENVPVDLTGCSITPKVFDTKHYESQFWEFYDESTQDSEYNEPSRKGEFNFDNYNSFLRWSTVLISPRHMLMCGHCYNDFCDLTSNDYLGTNLVYSYTQFLGKNNQIYKPFNNLQEAKNAADNNTLRILRCDTTLQCNACVFSGTQFILVEFPNSDWIDTEQVKTYQKIVVENNLPDNYPVYVLRGSGHVVIPGLSISTNNYTSYTGTINDILPFTWTGDSFSPVFLQYNGETILGYIVDETINFTDEFIDSINNFMNSSGYQIEKIYIELNELNNPNINTSSYFNLNTNLILEDPKYASKFKQHELNNKKIFNIGFVPGVQLQAAELNELQDNFTKQYTISNKLLSELIVSHIKKNEYVMYDNFKSYNESILYRRKYLYQIDYTRKKAILDGPCAIKFKSNLIYFDNIKDNIAFEIPFVRNYGDTTKNNNPYYSDELAFFLSDSAHRIQLISQNDNIEELFYYTQGSFTSQTTTNSVDYYTLEGELI